MIFAHQNLIYNWLTYAKSTSELISFAFSDRSVRSLVSAKRSAKDWSKKWNSPLSAVVVIDSATQLMSLSALLRYICQCQRDWCKFCTTSRDTVTPFLRKSQQQIHHSELGDILIIFTKRVLVILADGSYTRPGIWRRPVSVSSRNSAHRISETPARRSHQTCGVHCSLQQSRW